MFGTETAVNFYKLHLKVKSQQAVITISRFYIISSECHVSSFRGTAVSEIGKMLFAFFFYQNRINILLNHLPKLIIIRNCYNALLIIIIHYFLMSILYTKHAPAAISPVLLS